MNTTARLGSNGKDVGLQERVKSAKDTARDEWNRIENGLAQLNGDGETVPQALLRLTEAVLLLAEAVDDHATWLTSRLAPPDSRPY